MSGYVSDVGSVGHTTTCGWMRRDFTLRDQSGHGILRAVVGRHVGNIHVAQKGEICFYFPTRQLPTSEAEPGVLRLSDEAHDTLL